MARSKTAASTIKAIDHRKESLDYRRQGLSYRAIGEKMGKDPSQVCRWVKEGIAQSKQEMADLVEENLQLQLERLDTMIGAVWPKAEKGDPKSVEVVLRLLERQSKLLGLDAPTKTESRVSVMDGWTNAELVDEARKLGLQIPKELINVEVVDSNPAFPAPDPDTSPTGPEDSSGRLLPAPQDRSL